MIFIIINVPKHGGIVMLRPLATGNYLFSNENELYVIAESVAQNLNDFIANIAKYETEGKAMHITSESLKKLNDVTKNITCLG